MTLADFKELGTRLFASGVYAILPPEGDQVYYIGQSGDIVQRLKQHRKSKKWLTSDCRVRYYGLASPESRLVLETCLVLRYRPRHNRAIKLGLGADGSLTELQFLKTR